MQPAPGTPLAILAALLAVAPLSRASEPPPEAVLAEVRAVRKMQEQILELLRGRGPISADGAQLELGLPRAAPRSPSRQGTPPSNSS